jgi:prophage antirepressor-like protein
MVFDQDGQIWFGLKDLFRALGYTSLLNIYRLEIPKKLTIKLKKIKVSPSMRIASRLDPKTKMVDESGLYYILTKSTKPIAKDFLIKYITDIMPELRKTGQYIMNKTDKKKIMNLNKRLENLKDENNYLEDKHKYKPITPF